MLVDVGVLLMHEVLSSGGRGAEKTGGKNPAEVPTVMEKNTFRPLKLLGEKFRWSYKIPSFTL